MLIAVSLDIKNAFNSLPWTSIRKALQKKGFPKYLCKIIDDYLSGRSVEYTDDQGNLIRREVWAGVPQGSVLGPILWNIAYDEVLAMGTDEGCSIICYADDTLILAEGGETNRAMARANIQVGIVLNRIRRLGLQVAPEKTDMVCFRGRNKRISDRIPVLDVDGTLVPARPYMKYLGVIIDERLSFRQHLESLEKRVGSVARALSRITPNLRGPCEKRRKLYSNVILSVILYAAPM